MKPRSLLILAVVVAALGAFIWFVERDLPSTDERGERGRKVLPVDADEVDAVEIRVGDTLTRLEKEAPGATADEEVPPDANWRLVAPYTERADAEAVRGLLAALTELEKERTLEAPDLAGLGLAEPRASVVVSAGERRWALRVGEEVPASSNLIVGLGEEALSEAYVVSNRFYADLARPAGEWRSRQALAVDRGAIAAVRLRKDDEILLRRSEGGFVVVEPFADEADRDRVDELLTTLTGLEIATFVDGPVDPAALGLEPVDAGLSVTLEDGAVVELALGAAAPGEETERYLLLDGRALTAVTGLGELVDLEPDAWRSTAWSRLEVYEIEACEVHGEDGELLLERVDGEWRRDGEEIAYPAASDLLYAIADAEVESVVDPAALDLGEPWLEITLTTENGAETLRLYTAGSEGHAAARDGRGSILMLSSASVDELLAKVAAAREAPAVAAAPTAGVDDDS